MIPWKEQASTFDAPVYTETGEKFLRFKRYKAELRKENRSSASEYLGLENWEYSPSDTVMTIPRWRFQSGYFLIQEPIAKTPEHKILSLSEARKIALEILNNAEKRRQSERELESAYWSKLNGEE
jgi:hypothetical protein